jgi:tetratricopeptide (TPR) repeat protein
VVEVPVFPAFRLLNLRVGQLALAGLLAQPGAAQGGELSLFHRYRALEVTVQRAAAAVSGRRFEAAAELLAPCLQKVPEHFEAHFLMARMAYESKDFSGALAHLDAAKAGLKMLARSYREEMDGLSARAEAEEEAMRSSLDNMLSRGVDPTGCMGPVLRAKQSALDFLEMKKGHLFDRENPFGIPADHRFLRGNCLYRLGRRDEALAEYRGAVQADPMHAPAWNNLISLEWEAKAYPEAQADLDRAEAAHNTIRAELKQAVRAAR